MGNLTNDDRQINVLINISSTKICIFSFFLSKNKGEYEAQVKVTLKVKKAKTM